MSNTTAAANLSHDHNYSGERTLREWADIAGRKSDSVMKTVRRKLGNGHTLDTPMSADQFSALFTAKSAPAVFQRREPKTTTAPKAPSATTVPAPRQKDANYRRTILYILMAMPAAASIQNMYSVSADIAGHQSTALLLTGLFSTSPFLFVIAGMRSRWTKALTAAMIAYECGANTVRIYGGLTGFGHGDFPTRFLGLVTDLFDTGTYSTAKVLAVLMAGLAAATFYTAYNELNKK